MSEVEIRSVSLPMSVDAIDAAWLTATLQVSRPEVVVGSLKVRGVSSSTATRVFVDVEYSSDSDDLPQVLCIKGGFDCPEYESVR